jgi:hypothetical protein
VTEEFFTSPFKTIKTPCNPPPSESTVRYPGIEVDDALAIAEQVDV